MYSSQAVTEGLDAALQSGHAWSIRALYNAWGELYLHQQQFEQAYKVFTKNSTFIEDESPEQQAIALFGLARVAFGRQDHAEARRCAQESMLILQRFHHPASEEVVQWMQKLDEHDVASQRSISSMQKWERPDQCPHCLHPHTLHHHGNTRSGKQRFRCTHCHRTRTARTIPTPDISVVHAQKQRALALAHQGANYRTIAKELGVHPTTVGRWLKKEQMGKLSTISPPS